MFRSLILASFLAILAGQAALSQTTNTTTPTDPSIVAMQQQTAVLNAQAALLTAQSSVQTAQNAMTTAQLAPYTAAIQGLGSGATNLPSGKYSADTNGVVTPYTEKILLSSIANHSADISSKIPDGTTAIILVPYGQELTTQLQYKTTTSTIASFLTTGDQIKKMAQDVIAEHCIKPLPPANPPPPPNPPAAPSATPPVTPPNPPPKSGMAFPLLLSLAGSILPQIPNIFNSVAGLFRTDISQSVAVPGLPDNEVQAIFLGKYLAQPPPHAKVYLSLDSYFETLLPDISKTSTCLQLTHLNQYCLDLNNLQYQLNASAQYYTNDLAQLAKATGTPSPTSVTQSNTDAVRLAQLNDAINAIKTFVTNVGQFSTTLTTATATAPPPLYAVLYQELASDPTNLGGGSEKPIQLSLKIDNQYASTITIKGAFSQKTISSSFFGVEYRLTKLSGEIITADVLSDFDASKQPDFSKLADTELPASGTSSSKRSSNDQAAREGTKRN